MRWEDSTVHFHNSWIYTLLRQVAHEAHAGLSSPGLIAFLTLLFYHSSFPSLQGSESQAAEDLQMYMDANTLS